MTKKRITELLNIINNSDSYAEMFSTVVRMHSENMVNEHRKNYVDAIEKYDDYIVNNCPFIVESAEFIENYLINNSSLDLQWVKDIAVAYTAYKRPLLIEEIIN